MTAALTLQIFGAFPVINEVESRFLDCVEKALSPPVATARIIEREKQSDFEIVSSIKLYRIADITVT